MSYGNPKNRAVDQVLLDVKNGYITPEQANEFYETDLHQII